MGVVGWGTILSLRFFSVGLCWGGRTDFSWGLLTLVFHFILFFQVFVFRMWRVVRFKSVFGFVRCRRGIVELFLVVCLRWHC